MTVLFLDFCQCMAEVHASFLDSLPRKKNLWLMEKNLLANIFDEVGGD